MHTQRRLSPLKLDIELACCGGCRRNAISRKVIRYWGLTGTSPFTLKISMEADNVIVASSCGFTNGEKVTGGASCGDFLKSESPQFQNHSIFVCCSHEVFVNISNSNVGHERTLMCPAGYGSWMDRPPVSPC